MIKKIVSLLLLVTIFIVLVNNTSDYLTLEFAKENLNVIQSYFKLYYWRTISIYFLIYILTTTLSIPGATILSLIGGATFGFTLSIIIISLASTIGATFSFLLSRYFLRDYIQRKFNKKAQIINQGIEKEGAFYLLTMRLAPIFPFFFINLIMGLTKMKIGTYFITSWFGMLLGISIYVNAGLQLSKIQSISDILSPSIILSLLAIGVIPLLLKKVLSLVKKS